MFHLIIPILFHRNNPFLYFLFCFTVITPSLYFPFYSPVIIPVLSHRDKPRRVVRGADISLPTEGRDGDGFGVQFGKVVREPPVDVAHAVDSQGHVAGEAGDEGRAQECLVKGQFTMICND